MPPSIVLALYICVIKLNSWKKRSAENIIEITISLIKKLLAFVVFRYPRETAEYPATTKKLNKIGLKHSTTSFISEKFAILYKLIKQNIKEAINPKPINKSELLSTLIFPDIER